MKAGTMLVVLFVSLLFTSQLAAQDSTRADRTDRLREELAEVQVKEAVLRGRLEQINEAIKPENIERSLAGVGSTKPEELREHRRRMLTIERDAVLTQLQTLETRRLSLEASIAAAENEAYLRSAQPSSSPSTQMFVSGSVERSRWLWIALPAGLAGLLLGGAAAFVIARRRSS